MITIKSHAKINWYLRVLDRRPDGYHNLETVFQEIAMHDLLSFEHASDSTCSIMGFPSDVSAESNLITRAWELLRREFPGKVAGITVTAKKEIPRGGGLGGGSSNAAAALKAINTLFDLKISDSQLELLGATLGSDVPFFIRGGCAVGRGRGEQLSPASSNIRCGLVLVFPEIHLSTAEAYEKLSKFERSATRESSETVLQALMQNDLEILGKAIYNDFDFTVNQCAWFQDIVDLLEKGGCLRAFLCGSGSTVAGLVSDAGQIKNVLEYLHGNCTYKSVGCAID